MKRYTDVDLIKAVHDSTNWTDLFRRLGYENPPGDSSRQRMRNRAKVLGLELDKFKSTPGTKRKWTDDDLSRALDNSTSWSMAASKLGSTPKTIKMHAVRLGIDCSRYEKPDSLVTTNLPPVQATYSVELLRYSAESFAAFWYEMNGYEVFKPTSDKGTDLVVFASEKFSRVQVKSLTGRRGIHLTRRSAGGNRTPYQSHEVDEFFIICADGRIFRLPFEAVDGLASVWLNQKYDKYLVGNFAIS